MGCSRELLLSVTSSQVVRGIGDAVIRERMRLARQSFRRGSAYDFAPVTRKRRVLPIVAG